MALDALSYSVAGRLRAGPYPLDCGQAGGAPSPAELERIGITLFVDLTVLGELPTYADSLADARHVRHAIPDMSVTTAAGMRTTLDAVDAELAAGGGVYVHCWGGVGRTGTVVGCWLRRHRLDDGDPVARIAELRAGVRNAWMDSPQTDAQRQMARAWSAGA
jgi:Polymorphic toxin system, DSP-PTPase phosphatase